MLQDSEFTSLGWDAAFALEQVKRAAALPDLRRLAMQYRQALQPVDREWLRKKLALMLAAFGHQRDDGQIKAWLGETRRLLEDLPASIIAHAMDEALKRSERGWMPQVGQIRAIADPLHSKLKRDTMRLESMVSLMDGRRPAIEEQNHDLPDLSQIERGGVADDRIPIHEVDESNALMRQLRLKTRYRSDGSAFQLEPGMADPTCPPATL
ncbi:MAG: hypothetical protein DI623_12785 [Sphingomonas sanxanigenens]|uniref:Uncharacterized protein n=1 Tax=Sphingomonas sanxanigenens TaxID=397260 RepID=A0A2W5C2V5_9SPHN|nr:MAG: hypothetical protein DI623_12785 [Sphingomonas sanxanigenens]